MNEAERAELTERDFEAEKRAFETTDTEEMRRLANNPDKYVRGGLLFNDAVPEDLKASVREYEDLLFRHDEAAKAAVAEARLKTSLTTTIDTFATDNNEALVFIAELEIAVREFVIATQDDYANAGAILVRIKEMSKFLDERRKSFTKPLDERKAEIMAFYKHPVDTLAGFEADLKAKMVAHLKETERLRLEQEANTRRMAELARKAAIAEQEAALAVALDNGDEVEAERIIQAPAPVAMVVPTRIPPPVAGISGRKIWKYRVVNATLIPPQYWVLNEGMLNGLAKSGKGAVCIPGVEFYEETTIAAGNGR